MAIEELAKKYANALPNADLVKYYEAAIPQFSMDMILSIEREKPLTLLQEYILKFISEGICQVKDIYTFLGLSNSCVNSSIAYLQEMGLVAVDINSASVKLTSKGEEALKEVKTIVPEEVEYRMYMDGLTGEIYIDTLKKYQKKDLKEYDLMPIPPSIELPEAKDIQYEDVHAAIMKFQKENSFEKDKLEGKLLSVVSLEKVYTEYNKVSVLIYLGKYDGEIDLRVYEKSSRRKNYENILLQMYKQNTRIFELDDRESVDDLQEPEYMNVIPEGIKNEARAYTKRSIEIDKELTQLQTQLNDYQERTVEENFESKESTERIKELENQIEQLKNERESSSKVLFTYDHRPLLIKALKEVQDTVVIISPWIKKGGLNNEVLNLIDEAVGKGKRVIIGYGIADDNSSDPYILQSLNKIANRKNKGELDLIALNNTHEKVLLKDNDFLVVTSFNWLSFRGDKNRGFRQETGYYTESKESIKAMKENLSQSDRLGIKL